MKPLGPPPRIYGMKITSNRIEAFFVLFATIVLSLIFYANNFNQTSQGYILSWHCLGVVSMVY
jgi:hypothetical protein